MALADRFIYALLGCLFGVVVGIAGWWLYGLAYTSNPYIPRPGIDPVLRHWVVYASGAFALIGFLFRERVADVAGEAINAVYHFERDRAPDRRLGRLVDLAFLAMVLGAIWFTVPA